MEELGILTSSAPGLTFSTSQDESHVFLQSAQLQILWWCILYMYKHLDEQWRKSPCEGLWGVAPGKASLTNYTYGPSAQLSNANHIIRMKIEESYSIIGTHHSGYLETSFDLGRTMIFRVWPSPLEVDYIYNEFSVPLDINAQYSELW